MKTGQALLDIIYQNMIIHRDPLIKFYNEFRDSVFRKCFKQGRIEDFAMCMTSTPFGTPPLALKTNLGYE